MTRDRTIETRDGFACVVNGQQFGQWRSRAEARAGMRVEKARILKRQLAAMTKALLDEPLVIKGNG